MHSARLARIEQSHPLRLAYAIPAPFPHRINTVDLAFNGFRASFERSFRVRRYDHENATTTEETYMATDYFVTTERTPGHEIQPSLHALR